MIFVPDTNACSHFMRGHPVVVARWLRAAANIRLSMIVAAELQYGAAKSGNARQKRRVDELLDVLPAEPFGHADALEFGRLRSHLARRGELIGPYDLLIAAQALRLDATIVTHNVNEFRRVPGLDVEDWQGG